MIITLVTDMFYQNTHGTCVSAHRLYNGLVERGHTVKILAIDEENNTAYALKERYFGKPINKIINSQGFCFAKPDKEVMRKAIEGSDIVHVYLPFKLGYKAIQMCRELNVPCSAGFHIVPENITSTLYMENFAPINLSLWSDFHNKTYRYIKHIHCPSLMVAKQLVKHKFKANLHIISNGYNEMFEMERVKKPILLKDKFVITFIGRFSREKGHDLLIKAVNTSKYREKIQLVFGGKGPRKKAIMKMSRRLPNYPIFGFYNREQVAHVLNFADLYVHPANIEVEGMSCIEAIATGCVPVVANSEKSATPQFAVHEKSVFKNGDYKDLAEKIDWWIEHPEELDSQRSIVAEHAKKFQIEKSMDYYMNLFEAAINDWDRDYDGKNKKKAIGTKIINNYKK